MFASCEVTDLTPQNALSEETGFETPQRIELAVLGMYNAAQSGFYAGGQVRGYPFGAAHIQQGDMRGEDMLNQALFYAITYESTYSPASANNVFMWNTLFALVNQANVIIQGVQGAESNGVLTEAEANAYEAEARFLRALSYHQLLIHFARPFGDNNGANPGLPIRDFAVTNASTVDVGIAVGRNTVAECYDFILSDLDFAEANAPVTRGGNNQVVRVTSGAAVALKTRVYQHLQDWASVITEANKLVPNMAPFTSPVGNYALQASPAGPFTNNFTTESIFSILNSDVDNPGVNGALAAMSGTPALGGRGLIRISPIAYNNPFWRADDLRRSLLLTQDGRSYYTTKFDDYAGRSDNAPIIRYAEVLLNLSEAIVRNTNSVDARALALLNAVRDRALASPTTQTYTAGDFANANALLDAILNERRIEFLGEGLRWSDIHRLALDPNFSTGGIPAKMSFGEAVFSTYNVNTNPNTLPKSIPAIPYSDFRFLWPIPADELANNPTLAQQQNPGY
ncbi:MAG: RagB/SusD family nutrient uptake outer membrane protein [Microscillaceae bacterium]|nr:RagB/SusD family nutrient uptake outer membrane protein [Microscillaceae bacterium]